MQFSTERSGKPRNLKHNVVENTVGENAVAVMMQAQGILIEGNYSGRSTS